MTTDVVRKLNQMYDEASGNWFDNYTVPGVGGAELTVAVPREDRTVPAVRKHLVRKGAVMSAIGDVDLQAAINADAPIVHRAMRTGWRNNNTMFVSHVFVAGELPGTTVIPPFNDFAGRDGQVQLCGTLKEWKALVEIGGHSTTMTTALCAPFAAALMSLTRMPNFGIMLIGPSRCGKSTAQLMAASVMGFGDERDLPDLNATASGMLAAACAYNGHMMPLNEVATTRGARRDVYLALRETTYALMNGRDVTRHPSWSGGETATFQVLPLISSEISPDAWAARNSDARDPGETARLITLPAVYEGEASVFDMPPTGLSKIELDAWDAEQFRTLRDGLPLQRGTALKCFVEHLLGGIEESTIDALELIFEFEAMIATRSMNAIMRDIVRKFGLLYAGGILAIDARVLPFTEAQVKDAISSACRDALDALPDPEADLREGFRELRRRLSGPTVLEYERCTQKERALLHQADGYRTRSENGWQYVIKASSFLGWFTTRLRARRVLHRLAEEGVLKHSREVSGDRSIGWAVRQVTWRNGLRPRSVTLFLPGGDADLERFI